MFEAHNLYADECLSQQGTQQSAVTTKQPADLHLLHARYQCPLYIWFAQGKRKDSHGVAQPTWYIHIEYRQRNGRAGCHLLEVADDNGLPASIWQTLTSLELPQLCPEQTRLKPIRC